MSDVHERFVIKYRKFLSAGGSGVWHQWLDKYKHFEDARTAIDVFFCSAPAVASEFQFNIVHQVIKETLVEENYRGKRQIAVTPAHSEVSAPRPQGGHSEQ